MRRKEGERAKAKKANPGPTQRGQASCEGRTGTLGANKLARPKAGNSLTGLGIPAFAGMTALCWGIAASPGAPRNVLQSEDIASEAKQSPCSRGCGKREIASVAFAPSQCPLMICRSAMSNMEREILYLKVPSFPVAVEQLRDASLRGRPVAICTTGPGRALLQAVSPEARREGLYKGMLQQEALRSCPDLRLLPPNPELYLRITRLLFGLLAAYTPLVEPTQPGSLFLDLSGTRRLFGPARDLAWKVRKEIRERVGLEPRLGLAANKLLSCIATKVTPESSLCDVFPGGERHFLEPLNVTVLPALRTPTSTERVRELNIEKVSHLLPIQLPALQLAFGRNGLALYRQARGLDVSGKASLSISPDHRGGNVAGGKQRGRAPRRRTPGTYRGGRPAAPADEGNRRPVGTRDPICRHRPGPTHLPASASGPARRPVVSERLSPAGGRRST